MSAVKTIPHPTGSPQFKFAEGGDDMPSSIIGMTPMDTYIVKYKDGEGKEQNRICFRPPGTNTVFVLQEKISGSYVATSGHQWFAKAVKDHVLAKGFEEGDSAEAVDSI